MLPIVPGQKLYEQVISQIRDQIIRGVYQKGDALPSEKELTESTGVSRITVREALRILAETGVIETHKGKGSFVCVGREELGPDADGKKHDYSISFFSSTDARLILEPEIARQVTLVATQDDIGRIGATIEAVTSNHANETVTFHKALVETLANPFLSAFLDQLLNSENQLPLNSLIPPSKQKSVHQQLYGQHKKIFEMIKTRNAEFAYFYMKEHTMFVHDIYKEYFERFY